ARLHGIELLFKRDVRLVSEAAPSVVADPQLGSRAENVFCIRSIGVHDIRRNHRDFQTMLAKNCNERRKILLHAVGRDMPAFAYCKIHAIESDLSRALRQLLSMQKQQVLREDGYSQGAFLRIAQHAS